MATMAASNLIRRRYLSAHTLGLGVVALAAFAVVTALAGHREIASTPDFLARALGPSGTSTTSRPAPGVALRIDEHGLAVTRSGKTVRLAGTVPATSGWARFARGAERRTAFGLETVTAD